MTALAADDPRRPALLELRARQVLALSLDGGADNEPMAAIWALALAELGLDAYAELLGSVLGLVGLHLRPPARAELAAAVRADIPPLLVKLEGKQLK